MEGLQLTTRSGLIDWRRVVNQGAWANEAEVAQAVAQISESLERIVSTQSQSNIWVGQILWAMKTYQWYKVLGYETFESFVAESSMQLSMRTVRLLVQVVDLMYYLDSLENGEIASVPYARADISKLALVDRHVRHLTEHGHYADAALLLRMAMPVAEGGLSRSDLVKALAERGLTKKRQHLFASLEPGENGQWMVRFCLGHDPEAVPGKIVFQSGKIYRGKDQIVLMTEQVS